jgi:hypothetical protein
MAFDSLIFRVHAITRMLERSLTVADVEVVLRTGSTIESYPTDTPFPSYLVLGWRGNRPVHVVAADDVIARRTVVITVYEPDVARWDPTFTRRR